MKDLAERERLSPPMISRVVRSLEKRELLERVPREDDRRVCPVRVSDAGKGWISQYRGVSNAWLAERLSGLSDEERTMLADGVAVQASLIDEGNDLPVGARADRSQTSH